MARDLTRAESNESKTIAILFRAFYWLGVTLVALCFALTFASNTAVAWRWEHASLPLSWIVGLSAIVAFLVAEACHSVSSTRRDTRIPAVYNDSTAYSEAHPVHEVLL